MSGQVVLISTITGSAGLALLAAGGGLVVAAMIKSWMDEQHHQAQLKARERQLRMEQWNTYHQNQQSLVSDLVAHQQRLRENLEQLKLRAPGQSISSGEGPRGFVGEAYIAKSIETMLSQMPDDIRQSGVVRALQEQALRIDQEIESGVADSKLIDGFSKTTRDTVDGCIGELAEQQKRLDRQLAQTEELLHGALQCQELALDSAHSRDVELLISLMISRLHEGVISAGDIELFKNKLSQIKAAQRELMAQRALLQVTRERTQFQLQELGYHFVTGKDEIDFWQIPGGEQLSVRFQDNGALAFQVSHERHHESDVPMSEQEIDHLRVQEKRWCADLKLLVSRLEADGLTLDLKFERELPAGDIPVVVVEQVEEIIAATELKARDHDSDQ